jgi:predicted TIM-barrel fold metal-dependent hydrolase
VPAPDTPAPRAWTRRQFLASTPFATAAAKAASENDGYIDAHAHVWSADTQRWPRLPAAAGQNSGPAGFPPEVLLEHARRSGVTRVVLIQRGFYGNDNRYMLEVLRQRPGRFSAVARLDHLAPDAPAVMRRLEQAGVRGFRISPGGDPHGWLDSPAMDALWAFAANRLDEDRRRSPEYGVIELRVSLFRPCNK